MKGTSEDLLVASSDVLLRERITASLPDEANRPAWLRIDMDPLQ